MAVVGEYQNDSCMTGDVGQRVMDLGPKMYIAQARIGDIKGTVGVNEQTARESAIKDTPNGEFKPPPGQDVERDDRMEGVMNQDMKKLKI